MPISVTSVQIDLDKKNILAFTFASESDRAHFELHGFDRFKEELAKFIDSPDQPVSIITLVPGQDIKVIKVDYHEAISDYSTLDKPD